MSGRQPSLGPAWLDHTNVRQRIKQDRVFEERLFWVVTRSLRCFYCMGHCEMLIEVAVKAGEKPRTVYRQVSWPAALEPAHSRETIGLTKASRLAGSRYWLDQRTTQDFRRHICRFSS